MKKLARCFAIGVAIYGFSVNAAETNVSPGVGTLQAAIDNASDGDTLILTTGTYGDSENEVLIDKSLTIRAESASQDVDINMRIEVSRLVNFSYLILQGINLNGNHEDSKEALAIFGDIDEVKLLENTFNNEVAIGERDDYNGLSIGEVTLIGNKGICRSSTDITRLNIRANSINLLGNDLCLDKGISTGETYGIKLHLIDNVPSINMIGNKFEYKHYYNSGRDFIEIENNSDSSFEALIASNIILHGFGEVGTDPITITAEWQRNSDYNFISIYGDGGFTEFRNNIFKVIPDFLDEDFEMGRFEIVSDYTNTSFVNNVIDFNNVKLWQPSAEDEEDEEASINQSLDRFEGNIIVNYQDTVIEPELLSVMKNNLCFNNTVNCGTDTGNLDTDPLFTDPDNLDYSLQAGSPAINAGSAELRDYDTDGTRNDMGAYAGSWSIEQFDAQRADDAVGPYIYPLVDASKGVANGNLTLKFVTYPRLK